ncbi:hypothetical protein, partial [Salmonella sp. s55004]|uniref:hypothetical protein n=1 Tax=Salmonella sp. s55004 TaxID=3159675 RepID=UPI00397FC243
GRNFYVKVDVFLGTMYVVLSRGIPADAQPSTRTIGLSLYQWLNLCMHIPVVDKAIYEKLQELQGSKDNNKGTQTEDTTTDTHEEP